MKTKDELPACPVATAVALVGGKWKLLIIRNLRVRPWRFNELQRDSVWAKFAYTVTDRKVYNLGLPRWRADRNGQWIGDE